MPFIAMGVEHSTSSLSVREQVALAGDALTDALVRTVAEPAIAEVVILSTCNRTEFYLFVDDMAGAQHVVRGFVGDGAAPFLRIWQEMEAAEHLFRVAAGLESQVLGEIQIQHQVAAALKVAQDAGTVGPNLHALFRAAIAAARQARAGTTLEREARSVAAMAVAAAQREPGLEGRTVLLVGAGEVIRLAAAEVQKSGVKRIFFANRTPSAATEMAREFGGSAVLLDEVARVVPMTDVVMSATAARHYVLTLEDVAPRRRPLAVFDLAIPRDVDPAIGELDGVTLHDLDALVPAAAEQAADVRRMEGVIAAEMQEFMAWYLARRVAPVIASLRQHVEAVSEAELRRIAPMLRDLTPRQHAAVETLTNRLIDKMFHHLVTRLRLAAQTDPKLVEAAEFFFLHGEGGLFPHAAEQRAAIEVDRS